MIDTSYSYHSFQSWTMDCPKAPLPPVSFHYLSLLGPLPLHDLSIILRKM
jgi:hypothetical protein